MRLSNLNEDEYEGLADSDEFGTPTARLPYDNAEFPMARMDAEQAPIRTRNGGKIWTSPTGWRIFTAHTGGASALVDPKGKVVARGWWRSSSTRNGVDLTRIEFPTNKRSLLRRSGFLCESEYDDLDDKDSFGEECEPLIYSCDLDGYNVEVVVHRYTDEEGDIQWYADGNEVTKDDPYWPAIVRGTYKAMLIGQRERHCDTGPCAIRPGRNTPEEMAGEMFRAMYHEAGEY